MHKQRQYAEGRSEDDVPSTPEALEAAFRQSKHWSLMQKARSAYVDELSRSSERDTLFAAVADAKGRFVGKKSPYSSSFFSQVKALVRRQVQLTLQDSFGIWTSWFTAIGIALIVGSLFINLPKTAAGAFTRGGSSIFVIST
jgi:ATP-binding cassette subfamily G (WHITE) protein 2 (SNQ2)